MSLDLTRQSLIKTLLYFIVLAAIFWGGEFWVADTASTIHSLGDWHVVIGGTPLGKIIRDILIELPLLGVVMSGLLVFINSFMVTHLVVSNVMFLERSYMPSIIYLLISSGYYSSPISFAPLFATLMLLIACQLILRSYNDNGLSSGSYLTIGFTVGMAGLIYSPLLFLVIMLPIALIIFRPPDIREWIAALGGWLMPIFIFCYVTWLVGGDFTQTPITMWQSAMHRLPLPEPQYLDLIEWTFVGCTALLTITAIITFITHPRQFKPKQFKAYILMLWMLITSTLITTLLPGGSLIMLPVIALPFAVIIPTYFCGRKPNFYTNFIYALMVGCALMIHLLPLIR